MLDAFATCYDGTPPAGDHSGWLNAAILQAKNERKVCHIEPSQNTIGEIGYWIDQPLKVWDHSEVIGNPMMSTRIIARNCHGIVPGASEQNTTQVRLEGFRLSASEPCSPFNGIWALRTSRSTITRVYVDDFRVCINVDGHEHPTTLVSGAIDNRIYDFTVSQQNSQNYWHGVLFTGEDGETGKAHANGIAHGYVQADLFVGGPKYTGLTGIYFQSGRGNIATDIRVSGYKNGFDFSTAECHWFGGYAQLCETIARFRPTSERCSAVGIAATAADVVNNVSNAGAGNRWQVGSSVSL